MLTVLPDRDEYLKARTQNDAAFKSEDLLTRLGTLRRAAVAAELLTGNPHWDEFLSHIQAAIEETERQREGFREWLDDPTIVDDNEVRRYRNAILACNERIGAWKTVMSLPRELIEKKGEIKALMDRLETV